MLENRQKVFDKATELSFAARAVIDQLTLRDGSQESRQARDILETGLGRALESILNGSPKETEMPT